jgi:hypothetical protein
VTPTVGVTAGETLDSFYAELRRCRERCDGRQAHVCRPLAASTVRQIHWILSGDFERAVRWKWVAVSPPASAEPPAPPRPNPSPLSAADATRIPTEAWKDPAWNTFLRSTRGRQRRLGATLRARPIRAPAGAVRVIRLRPLSRADLLPDYDPAKSPPRAINPVDREAPGQSGEG